MTALFCRRCLLKPFKVVPTWTRQLGTHPSSRAFSPLSDRLRLRNAWSPGRDTYARLYQNLAQQPPTNETTAPQPPKPEPEPKKQDLGGDAVHVSQAEQRRRDWNIIRRMSQNLWPKDDWNTRGRVLFGLGLLIGGKVRALDVVF